MASQLTTLGITLSGDTKVTKINDSFSFTPNEKIEKTVSLANAETEEIDFSFINDFALAVIKSENPFKLTIRKKDILNDIAEIYTLTFTDDVSNSNAAFENKYFIIYASDSERYNLWFNVGGTGSAPIVEEGTMKEVLIATTDTSNVIATKVKAVIDSITSKFVTSLNNNVITVTLATAGSVTNAALGDLASNYLAITTTTQGQSIVYSEVFLKVDRFLFTPDTDFMPYIDKITIENYLTTAILIDIGIYGQII